MPLPKETRTIADLPQQVGIEFLHRFGSSQIPLPRCAVGAACQPRKDGRAAHPANGMAHHGLRKPRSSSCECIYVRGLNERMPIAAEGGSGLIIREEKDDVRRTLRCEHTANG